MPSYENAPIGLFVFFTVKFTELGEWDDMEFGFQVVIPYYLFTFFNIMTNPALLSSQCRFFTFSSAGSGK